MERVVRAALADASGYDGKGHRWGVLEGPALADASGYDGMGHRWNAWEGAALADASGDDGIGHGWGAWEGAALADASGYDGTGQNRTDARRAHSVRGRNGKVASSGAADSSTKKVPKRSITNSISRRPFSADAQCG